MKRDRISFMALVVLLGLALTAGCLDSGSDSSGEGQFMTVAEVAEQDVGGVAVHLGETVTTEGIVTVGPGELANKKLKVFIQGSPEGVMVYHESSAEVEEADFQPGNRVRVTGVIRQADPSSDNNPATGTVMIDISEGSWRVLSTGNPLPLPVPVTLAELESNGNTYEGSLVCVLDVNVSGDWQPDPPPGPPTVGGKTKWVTMSDETAELTMRLERNTITSEMVEKLTAIGEGPFHPFHLIGIVAQNDPNESDGLLEGFQIWPRGASDIIEPITLLGAEDAEGTAVRLDETVTAAGIVTVASGMLFESKFEVFIQDSTGGLMLLNATPPPDLAVSPGDLVLATGTVAQTDGSGQKLEGTVRISFSGALEVLRSGLGVPSPQCVTIADYLADSGAYEGELIRINGASKDSGEWPAVDTKSKDLYITDPTSTLVKLQIQKGASTTELAAKLDAIGDDGSFDVVGIAVQNDTSWEVWIRSADDIIITP